MKQQRDITSQTLVFEIMRGKRKTAFELLLDVETEKTLFIIFFP